MVLNRLSTLGKPPWIFNQSRQLCGEVPDALFFLGVLFAVGGLERVGLLKEKPRVTATSWERRNRR